MRDLVGQDTLDFHWRPLGAAMVGSRVCSDLVMIDAEGVMWCVASGERADLVRWCRERAVRSFIGLGELVDNMRCGYVVGLVPVFAARVAVPWRRLEAVAA